MPQATLLLRPLSLLPSSPCSAGSHVPDHILSSENTQHWPLPTECLGGNPTYTPQSRPLSTVTLVQAPAAQSSVSGSTIGKGVGTLRTIGDGRVRATDWVLGSCLQARSQLLQPLGEG